MKFLIMLGATAAGIYLGMRPKIDAPRPSWWMWLAVAGVTATILLGLTPPIGGTFTDVVVTNQMDSSKIVPWYARVEKNGKQSDGWVLMSDVSDSRVLINVAVGAHLENTLESMSGKDVIISVKRYHDDLHALAMEGRSVIVAPILTLPYIAGLEERARLIYFHVPMSWVATVAYLISMIFAVLFLRKRSPEYDTRSMAAASVGTLYAILATITGAVWARFNWGSFWNWDPRETSIFLLLLVYFAYFLLRGSIDDPERRARLSSAYSIVAFVTVPFLVFVLPRMMPGLHPGSADDVTAGPLLSPKSDAINVTKQILFGLSLFSFTLIFFWMMSLRVRLETLTRQLTMVETHD